MLYGLLAAGERAYGDAPMLAQIIETPRPYYNALYVPLGYVLHELVGRPLGWDEWTSLRWLSVLTGAVGCSLLAWVAARRLRDGRLFAAWVVVAVTAPALVFYASIVEVQGMQFAGACAALLLGLSAARARGARSGVLLLCGAFLACASHVLGAFLVPALILLAWRPRSGRGLSARTALWAVPLALLAPVAINLAERRILESIGEEDFSPSLLQMAAVAASGLRERGLFGLSESADWIAREVVLASGFMLLALIATGRRRGSERRLTLAALLALAPIVIVLPQLGIRENGAYVLSSLPPVLLLGAAMLARYRHALLRHRRLFIGGALLLAAGQLALGVEQLRRQPTRGELQAWVARAREGRMSGLVYVSSMVRAGALPEAGIGIRTSCPQKILERIPRRRQAEAVKALLLETLKAKKQSERVYVDADLVRGPPRGPAGVADFVARLNSPPSSLVPAGDGSGFYEVVLP